MNAVEVETFYGQDGRYPTPYLTRIALVGDLTLHVFHRGDADPDPHDHRRAFVTLPLTSYVEEVYDPAANRLRRHVVLAGRPHFRRAGYAHRVVGRWSGRSLQSMPQTREGGIVTLVLWFGRARREWGFWVRAGEASLSGEARRRWVPWRDYVFGGGRGS